MSGAGGARPRFIVKTSDVPERQGSYPRSDELLAAHRAIGAAAGLERVGLNVSRVPPGHRTSWPHAEEKEEEFVFVLEGSIDAWVDGVLYPMEKGDLAAFPAGTGVAHSFINNGDRDALLLVGGERDKDDNRIFYPLHPGRRQDIPEGGWWTDAPPRPLGPHDSLPDARRGRPAK